MNNYTQGPWFVHDEDAKSGIFIVNDETTIAKTMCGNDKLNAFLISSAPDLFEALQYLMGRMRLEIGSKSLGMDDYRRAEIAIAKATGKSA